MGGFSEFILVAAGALSITFTIHWIVLPLFYGIPMVLYWTFRRYLKWRTPFLYLSKPAFNLIVVLIAATGSLSFFSAFMISFLTGFWFGSGVLLGLGLWLGRILTFQSVRSEIHYDLVARVKAYVTPKGRMALLALLSRW